MIKLVGNAYGILVDFRELVDVDASLFILEKRRCGCGNGMMTTPTVIKLCTETFFFGFAQLNHRPKFSVKDAGWKERHDRSITALVLLRAVLDPFNRIFQARSR